MNSQVIIIKSQDNPSTQQYPMDVLSGQFIEPFFSFEAVLNLYYTNTYHRSCIRIKSNILSQIESTDLDRYLPKNKKPKRFLKELVTQAEIFGNVFIELAGTPIDPTLYIIPAHECRIDRYGQIYQYLNGALTLMNGAHYSYYSPKSRFYGEPDYLATVKRLQTEEKIDSYNDVFFDNNAMPNMAIFFENSEPSEKQLDGFQQFFGSSFKGYQNAHKTLVLSTGKDADKDGRIRMQEMNRINDMSFEKFKNMNREEIIAAHNVPPRLVGIISSGQLGGGNELIGQLHQFNQLEILPKIDEIESFFQGLGIQLKLKPIDPTAFKDDASVVQGLVQLGIVTVDEAREVLGWQKAQAAGDIGAIYG